MIRAKQIFLSFFDSDEDFTFFNYAHNVSVEPNKWPAVAEQLLVEGGSFDDKPASIIVYNEKNKYNEYSIYWWNEELQTHRLAKDGPALIIKFRNGKVRHEFYEGGYRVKKPKGYVTKELEF